MASMLSQQQFGQLRGLRAKLLRRYEHQSLVSCLSGLYGCQWRRYEKGSTQPGDCCCNKVEAVSFALLVAAFCLTLVFLYFWGQAKNDYNDFDWFNFGKLGFWFPWSVVLLVIAAGFFTYITILMLLAVCLLSEGQQLYLHWSHKLAPENTLMSFEKAVEAGSEGLETDVTISVDGVPFLMHDHTLQRTTNVHQVFPNRTDTPAAMFTWAELENLNAGAWFLSHNPFGTAGFLGTEERLQAGKQCVCSLQAFLQLAAQRDKLVIFDLYRPPSGHPYRDSWIQRTLDVIENESSIHSSQVLWLPSDRRAFVESNHPELQQTSGRRLPLEELQSDHIVKLNLHYSSMSTELTRECAAVNITTNLYVISQPWLFSLAWCTGVHSVTTDAPQLLSTMRSPLFLMSPDEYNLMWILTDLMSLVLITIIFIFHWWRERGLAFCSGSKITLDNSTYSKFKTEMSDIWSVSSGYSQAEKMPNLATVTEH
ncbi:glycerophosphodiester phosphodiesterase domain-containing protein 5 isoform X2 [Sander vitreus]